MPELLENRSINDEKKLITLQKSRLEPALPCLDTNCKTKESPLSKVSILETVLKHNTKLLVDTSAAISVINDDVLRCHFLLKENKKIENIRTANGRVVPVSRNVTFPIRIRSLEYIIDAPGGSTNALVTGHYCKEGKGWQRSSFSSVQCLMHYL